MRRAALVLAAIALTGCETTAEKSAQLEKAAEHSGTRRAASTAPITFSGDSRYVKVLAATVVRSSEGAAAVVSLRNTSSRELHQLPIAITVKNSTGKVLYQNNTPGTEAALLAVPSIGAHASLNWVDDQVPANGEPSLVDARVGEGRPAAALPALTVSGVHAIEDPTNGEGVAGGVVNPSARTQPHVVVYAVARHGAQVVAAGRAVLPEVSANATTPFQAFFIGSPHGARLEVSAPATTPG